MDMIGMLIAHAVFFNADVGSNLFAKMLANSGVTNCFATDFSRSWWRGLDSNQRRLSQRIYSPSPLATRAPLPREKDQRNHNTTLNVRFHTGLSLGLPLGLQFVNPFLLKNVLVLFFYSASHRLIPPPDQAQLRTCRSLVGCGQSERTDRKLLSTKCRTADRGITARLTNLGPNIAFEARQ